jgi:hypothetical protein
MIPTRWLLLSLGLLVGLGLAGRAAAEDPDEAAKREQSHLVIPLAIGDPQQVASQLHGRLRNAENQSDIRKLLESPELRKLAEEAVRDPKRFGLTPEKLNELRQWARDPSGPAAPSLNDPTWRKLLTDLAGKQGTGANPALSLPPDQQERLQRILKNNPPDAPSSSGIENPSGPQNNPPLRRQTPSAGGGQPDGSPGQMPSGGNLPGPANPAPPNQPDTPPDTQARLSKELLQIAQRLRQADPALANSPALKDFVGKVSRYAVPSGKSSLHLPESARHLGNRFRLSDYLNPERLHLDPSRWQPPRGLLPPAPHFPARPVVNLPRSAGRFGVPRPAATAGAVWQQLLWALVVLGFGVALWRVLAWQRARTAAGRGDGWRLGPWPVPPAAVATRLDLVHAFDYLALLRLGPAARTWNHLEIAARLGDGARSPARRQAADRLAHLYEQARYAPPSDPIPDAELAAARRHLCLLAGVPAA